MQELLQIREPAQVRALGHPLRLAVLDALAEGPATNLQLAERLGASPSKMFFHVRQLLRAGLIRRGESRVVGGVVEKYYEPVARRFLLERGDSRAAGEPRAGAVLATAVAEYEAALERFGPTGADYDAAHLHVRLRPEDAGRARARIWELLDDLRAMERADGRPFTLTCMLHPRAGQPG
jgi:DNA-binding transcriptional ArsR family regulator